MTSDDIHDALEATTPCPRVRGTDRVRTADRPETILWRDTLMRFLSEIDADVTVEELRAALEDYQ